MALTVRAALPPVQQTLWPSDWILGSNSWTNVTPGRQFAKTRVSWSPCDVCSYVSLPYDVYWRSMPKLRTNIYLTEKQKASLEKLYDKTGAPVAELVRRAVDSFLTMRRKELK